MYSVVHSKVLAPPSLVYSTESGTAPYPAQYSAVQQLLVLYGTTDKYSRCSSKAQYVGLISEKFLRTQDNYCIELMDHLGGYILSYFFREPTVMWSQSTHSV